MKKLGLIVVFSLMVFNLTACSMVSWESGFEDEYTENADGTLTTKDGKILDAKGNLLDSSDPNDPKGDNLDDHEADDPIENNDDPYRTYDDGVISYNYDEMTLITDGPGTYYIKTESGLRHGMYFNTFDGVVENGLISITYYYDGEEIRHVEFLEYPLIESDRRYFDVWTDEFYFYYPNSEQVSEYHKREYIESEWIPVERINYYENGTIYEKRTFTLDSQTYVRYDVNGMITFDLDISYPRIFKYSYYEDGTLAESLEGRIDPNIPYEQFIEIYYNVSPFRIYLEAISKIYRPTGVIEEVIEYGVMTLHRYEYDENGTITFEDERGFSEYHESNQVIWSVTRTYVDGELYEENCWDDETYDYCEVN